MSNECQRVSHKQTKTNKQTKRNTHVEVRSEGRGGNKKKTNKQTKKKKKTIEKRRNKTARLLIYAGFVQRVLETSVRTGSRFVSVSP